jgi:HlyD family secretion protein
LLLVAAGALLLSLLAGLAWLAVFGFRSPRQDLLSHAVHYETVQRAISESGTVQAIENRDVVCRVKSRIRNSTFVSTIVRLVDEGTLVRRGGVVAVLDTSAFEEDLRDQRIAVLKARSDLRQAEENCKIVASQNALDLQNAQVVLDLAILDLEKFRKADYEQLRQDVLGRLKTAQADVEGQRDRVGWAELMLRKGFLAPTQTQTEYNRLRGLELNLTRVREEERVLENFTYRRTLTDLEGKMLAARSDFERVRSQNLAKEVQANSDRLAKQSILNVEERRQRVIEEQIAGCTLRAPQEGLVVYYESEQSRRTQQGIIALGEPVREGQRLMQIPDLRHMMVDVGLPEQTLFDVHEGDAATIEVHALPNRLLHGHVKRIAETPSELDWWMTARKVYHAEIDVDDPLADLLPGMRAEVKILADKPAEHVLAVPVEALLEPAHSGDEDKCYVLTPDGPEERVVTVGLSNNLMVEVRKGLEEGDEVVVNPRTLQNENREPAGH